MEYIPSVVQAVAGENYTVYAYFTDGTVRLFDVKPLINRGGVFAQISDRETFAGLLTVLNDTVAWDLSGTRDESSCIDLDPITVYRKGVEVDDPLGSVA
ncbi:DUF2442 domain-containing protein [Olsenella uli]|uniref:DUF2442 domain-containing protein n=1 Tax=Olsenella uli TaxID=133926 RepID=UPI0019584F4F|nr:DUF2442 domain-containing protein [Olsenella uli]MBM6815867.1 DUF2442 domain-containing protein [Olsenella uli]